MGPQVCIQLPPSPQSGLGLLPLFPIPCRARPGPPTCPTAAAGPGPPLPPWPPFWGRARPPQKPHCYFQGGLGPAHHPSPSCPQLWGQAGCDMPRHSPTVVVGLPPGLPPPSPPPFKGQASQGRSPTILCFRAGPGPVGVPTLPATILGSARSSYPPPALCWPGSAAPRLPPLQ